MAEKMDMKSMNRSANNILNEYQHYMDVLAAIITAVLALGVIGNSLVIVVYYFKKVKKKNERYFVPILAIVDLLATIIGAAHGYIICFKLFSLTSSMVWGTMIFLVGLVSFMSILLLFCIALQRYLMVVKNTKIPLKWLRIMTILSILIAIAFALPLLFSFEITEFTIENVKIGTRPTHRHRTLQTWFGVGTVVFVTGVYISFLVMYGRIWCKLQGHQPPSGLTRELSINCRSVSRETLSNLSHNSSEKRRKRYKKMKTKFTLMFIVITSVFLVCITPQTVIVLLESLREDFWESLTMIQFIAMTWTTQLYLVNNIINPFVYAFMDAEFKVASRSFIQTIRVTFGSNRSG